MNFVCLQSASVLLSVLHNHISKINHTDKKVSKITHKKSNLTNANTPKKQTSSHVKMLSLTHPVIRQVSANRAARAALISKYKVDMSTYFDVKTGADVKISGNSVFDRELKLLDDELAVMRATFRSEFQNQSLRINLYQSTSWDSSVAGVVGTTQSVDVTGLTEFSSLAALFDEFRVVGGVFDLQVVATCIDTAGNRPWVVMAYDPSDNTTPAAVTELLQIEQHILMPVPVIATGFNAYPHPSVTHHRFKWKVPKGIFLQQVSGTAVVEGAWQSTTNGTPSPYGFEKMYGSTFQASAKLAVAAINTFHTEFRCRT